MRFLTVFSLLLVAVTMATSLAHTLEWPGKRRLGEAAYKTTQAIYYPGFTFGGLFGVKFDTEVLEYPWEARGRWVGNSKKLFSPTLLILLALQLVWYTE